MCYSSLSLDLLQFLGHDGIGVMMNKGYRTTRIRLELGISAAVNPYLFNRGTINYGFWE